MQEDPLGFLDGKVAHGVEDPVERETQFALAALAGTLQRGKDGLEGFGIEVTPHINDAYRNEDFGVNHALLGELLHHAPGGQFVIFRADEQPGNGFEGFHEAGEISELIERFASGSVSGLGIVAGAQLYQRGGKDRSFEVEMQFGFGKAADKAG